MTAFYDFLVLRMIISVVYVVVASSLGPFSEGVIMPWPNVSSTRPLYILTVWSVDLLTL